MYEKDQPVKSPVEFPFFPSPFKNFELMLKNTQFFSQFYSKNYVIEGEGRG